MQLGSRILDYRSEQELPSDSRHTEESLSGLIRINDPPFSRYNKGWIRQILNRIDVGEPVFQGNQD